MIEVERDARIDHLLELDDVAVGIPDEGEEVVSRAVATGARSLLKMLLLASMLIQSHSQDE